MENNKDAQVDEMLEKCIFSKPRKSFLLLRMQQQMKFLIVWIILLFFIYQPFIVLYGIL